MIPFRYWDFYDVPHLMLLQYQGSNFLPSCPFDDKLDDFGDRYEVYKLFRR